MGTFRNGCAIAPFAICNIAGCDVMRRIYVSFHMVAVDMIQKPYDYSDHLS